MFKHLFCLMRYSWVWISALHLASASAFNFAYSSDFRLPSVSAFNFASKLQFRFESRFLLCFRFSLRFDTLIWLAPPGTTQRPPSSWPWQWLLFGLHHTGLGSDYSVASNANEIGEVKGLQSYGKPKPGKLKRVCKSESSSMMTNNHVSDQSGVHYNCTSSYLSLETKNQPRSKEAVSQQAGVQAAVKT